MGDLVQLEPRQTDDAGAARQTAELEPRQTAAAANPFAVWPPPWLAAAVEFLRGVHEGGVAAVIGAPQTGKSAVLKAADEAGVLTRRLTYDPFGRRDRGRYERGESKAPPWGGLWCSPAELASEDGKWELNQAGSKIVVDPGTLDRVAMGKIFSAVVELLWSTGRVDLVPEEAALYSREATDLVLRISAGGSHANMRVFFVLQSLTRLHIDARRCLSHLVVFNQDAAEDLTSLRARCGPAFVARVQALQRGMGPLFWKSGDSVE